MNSIVNPEMIQLARESRGLNRTELAAQIGVTQPHISQLETAQRSPSSEVMQAICAALDYPIEFFAQPGEFVGLGLSVFFYRKKAATSVADIRRLEAEVNARRIHLKRLLDEINIATPKSIEFMDINDHAGDAGKIAAMVRASWQLPLGPVRNLVQTIEKAGGVVFKFAFGTPDIDAVSQWPVSMPPLFFINSTAPADRVRFSLAHELGHVVMHQAASETMEDEANQFAAEFLMPARDIAPELDGLNLARAASLKPYWRVSMAALIRRARDVGRISTIDYQRLMRRLSATGQRKRECVDIVGEEPTLLEQIIEELSRSCGYDDDDFARIMRVNTNDFAARFKAKKPGLRLAGA